MFAKPMVAQEWSVHAQLTISHQRPPGTPPPLPTSSSTGMSSNGDQVQMEYSWRSQPGATMTTSTTTTASRPCYGFQRGNILFTTRPPARETPPVTTSKPQPSRDSGYSSSQFSYNSLPTRKPTQPYNRRCKSTCSIVLNQTANPHCSDPVCYHSAPTNAPFSSVPEACEVCGGGRSPTAARRASRLNTFTTHFCTRVPEKAAAEKLSKDAASQTLEGLPQPEEMPVSSEQRPTRRALYNTRSKTDSQLLDIPGSSGSKPKVCKRVTRSPAKLRGKSPLLSGRRSQGSQCSEVGNKQKPRTVHIDVYCTGSEDADASSSSDTDTMEEGDSLSSPQTVYESEKFRVVHTRAGKSQLPQSYVDQKCNKKDVSAVPHRKSESFKCESVKESPVPRGYESDDVLSSSYPSKQSSCTWLNDNLSVVSDTTRDLSTVMSSSSCALSGDGYESVTATSWKDTGTDLDSLVHSTVSLAQSDSFDYADSIDKLRIRAKEKAWEDSKCWRSPQHERKHLLQQEKLKEYLEKNKDVMPFPLWKPESVEDSEDDDETGDAWSIGGWDCSQKPGSLKREDTVKMVNKDKLTGIPAGRTQHRDQKKPMEPENSTSIPSSVVPTLHVPVQDTGSLSDSGPAFNKHVRRTIGPFGSRSPSPPPPKVVSRVMSPFGKTTNQLVMAQKFGTIVGAFRKPGHHVGPSKNPDCLCEHCRRFYEETGHRVRTRSVGDVPQESSATWRANSVPASLLVERVPADFDTQSETSSVDCELIDQKLML